MFLGEPGTYVKLILQRPAISANGRSKTVVVQVERRVQPSGEAPLSNARDAAAFTSTPVSSGNTVTRSQARMPEVVEPSPATAPTSRLGAEDETDSPPRPRHSGAMPQHEGWHRIPFPKRQEDFGARTGLTVDRALAFNELDSRHADDGSGRGQLPVTDNMPRGQAAERLPVHATETPPPHLNAARRYASQDGEVPWAGGMAGSPQVGKAARLGAAATPGPHQPPWPRSVADVAAGAPSSHKHCAAAGRATCNARRLLC